MAKSPDRNRAVYVLGAGFSKAFGLPNTAELLSEVESLSKGNRHWGVARRIPDRLTAAYRYFYPDDGENFRPSVGDFFTVLSTYNEIAGVGLPQGFQDHPLIDDLKFAIASILCSRIKEIDSSLKNQHSLLDEVLVPGNIVITSNWDTALERACIRREIPFRLRGYDEKAVVTILKLHGSIDWTLRDDAKQKWSISNYYRLEDTIGAHGKRRGKIAKVNIARCHAIERSTRSYQTIKGSTKRPFMLTMARGKTNSVKVIESIWSDCYHALSRAKTLDIVGYSMPDDDVEIRTLLRAGVCRGSRNPFVTVVNPDPSVHIRVRQQVHNVIHSNYGTVSQLV